MDDGFLAMTANSCGLRVWYSSSVLSQSSFTLHCTSSNMAKLILLLSTISAASAFQSGPPAGHRLYNRCIKSKIRKKLHKQPFVLSTVSEVVENGDDNLRAIKGRLTKEFFSIGLPAFIQLAAEPLAALVDTAYLGRLGPEVLGGAGVAISAQYAVSKVCNCTCSNFLFCIPKLEKGIGSSSDFKI